MKTRIHPAIRAFGFTLVELMIAVAIVGVLALIATPMYKNHVISGYRATAQADIMALAQAAERFYSRQAPYTYDTGATTTAAAALILSPNGDFSPRDGSREKRRYDVRYVVGCSASDATLCTTYTVVATPVSGTIVEGDGSFCLDSTGVRTWATDSTCATAVSGTTGWSKN